jgi:hypothetical protein
MWWHSIVDALTLAAVGMLVGTLVEWLWSQTWELRFLIESTLFMRRVRAEARSHTPGGSASPGQHPQCQPGKEAGDAEPPTKLAGAAPAASGAAVSHPETAAPTPAPVDADLPRGPASTGPTSAGAGRTPSPPTSPAPAEANSAGTARPGDERRPVGKAGRRGAEVETVARTTGSLGPHPNSVGGGASAPAAPSPTGPYLSHR